jgi:hypothetical protein
LKSAFRGGGHGSAFSSVAAGLVPALHAAPPRKAFITVARRLSFETSKPHRVAAGGKRGMTGLASGGLKFDLRFT